MIQARNTIHNVAEDRYTPQPYRGAASLICIGPCENEDEWREVVGTDLELVSLPCRDSSSDHNAHPTDVVHLKDLTEALERILKGSNR